MALKKCTSVLPGQSKLEKEQLLLGDAKIFALRNCVVLPGKTAQTIYTTVGCSNTSTAQFSEWSAIQVADFIAVKEYSNKDWEVLTVGTRSAIIEVLNMNFGIDLGPNANSIIINNSYQLTMIKKGISCGGTMPIAGIHVDTGTGTGTGTGAGTGTGTGPDAGTDAGTDTGSGTIPGTGTGDSSESADDDGKDKTTSKDKKCPQDQVWRDDIEQCVRIEETTDLDLDDGGGDDDTIIELDPTCPPPNVISLLSGKCVPPPKSPPAKPPQPTIGTRTLHTPQFKFKENDIFHNVIKSHPRWSFMMYFNDIYLNRRPDQGTYASKGEVSLYEMNVQTASVGKDPSHALAKNTRIRAYVAKGANPTDVIFKTVATSSKGFTISQAGEKFVMDYPLTSSIMREMVIAIDDVGQPKKPTIVDGAYDGVETNTGVTSPKTAFKIMSLKNIYDFQRTRSKYFDFDKYIFATGGVPPKPLYKSFGPKTPVNLTSQGKNTTFITPVPKNKYTTLIAAPSIFYGSGIRPGSVDLQFFWTGSLLARAQDVRKNGELVETYGGYQGKFNSGGTGSVIGTVIYNAGVILITGSYQLNSDNKIKDGYLCPTSSDTNVRSHGVGTAQAAWRDYPRWAHFGKYQTFATSSTPLWKSVDPKQGTPQGDPAGRSVSASYAPASSSYVLNFEGTEKTPVLTLLAHAKKNELNWSNNSTYLMRSSSFSGKDLYEEIFINKTSSMVYRENKDIAIKNTVSSSFCGHTASYKSQTFISKIGIYNECKELIAIAKLATPIRKTNEQDYTFKLKLDL